MPSHSDDSCGPPSCIDDEGVGLRSAARLSSGCAPPRSQGVGMIPECMLSLLFPLNHHADCCSDYKEYLDVHEMEMTGETKKMQTS